MPECTRCHGEQRTTLPMYSVRMGGRSLPSSSWHIHSAPHVERVCGDCITDDELLLNRDIADVLLFVTEVLMRNLAKSGLDDERKGECLTSIEMVRACFLTRNHSDNAKTEKCHRTAALKVIGLDSTEEEK